MARLTEYDSSSGAEREDGRVAKNAAPRARAIGKGAAGKKRNRGRKRGKRACIEPANHARQAGRRGNAQHRASHAGLLKRLLEGEIRQERAILLQAFRYFVGK